MRAVLSHSCRAILFGALFVTASPPAAGDNRGVHVHYGSNRHVVLQVRGGS